MTILFWILLFLIFYCYLLYPVIVYLLAGILKNPVHQKPIEPTLSVVISLYNEEDVIGAKLQNLLNLDYPSPKIEILIGSDGSTDRTHVIINQFNDPRIRLYINPLRQGKMATLNELIPKAKNEIIIFTDARQIFEKSALRNLVSNFADPKIGCVSGELIFSPKEGGTAQGVNLYWNYEKFIRRQESLLHSMLGATGAIYAIRKELFTPGPVNIVLDDMFTPFKIIQKGYRAIFDDTAFAYDQVADDPKEEYRRKTRTLYGNFQIFSIFPGMFIPFKSPIAWQLFSHKFLRVIIPFFLIILFIISWALRSSSVFDIFWILQLIFYGMALLGHLFQEAKSPALKPVSKTCYIPYVFCLLNFSALVGFWRFINANQEATWEKARKISNDKLKK